MPQPLYVATSNRGKLRDFAHASHGRLTLIPLPNLTSIPEPVESAPTFEGNARIKALAYSALAPGHIVLADDSGIELPALGGAPGVHSARYAQDHGFVASSTAGQFLSTKDELNNECLLVHAANLNGPERHARYRCVLAAARDGKILTTAEGHLEGVLLDQPRGTDGFGYDPLFLLPELDLTMAEINPEARLHYSHRARALAHLIPRLPL